MIGVLGLKVRSDVTYSRENVLSSRNRVDHFIFGR